MGTVFVRHRVADYESWRSVYDDDLPRRQAAGLEEVGVFQEAGDANNVFLVWRTDSFEGFEELAQSESSREKMKEAGVVGEPEVWFSQE